MRKKSSAKSSNRRALGKLVKTGRLFSGLTLRQAAVKTGVSNPYISQLENGRIKEPSPHKLKALADAYKVDYGMLFDAAGYPRP